MDFAYIRPAIQICFEIDGYGPHLKNISRWQFSDNLERQNQLVIDGWTVIRFSYDQVKEKPRRCQQIVQQVIGRWLGDELDQTSLSFRRKGSASASDSKRRSHIPYRSREVFEVK